MDTKTILKKLVETKTLGHGYILFGEDETALAETTRWLTYFLEKNPIVLTDAFLLVPHQGSISIDAVRALKLFLWQRPIASPYRTVVVQRADTMTLEAQNAFLKVAEEPPPHGLLFVLTKDPLLLAPTILSRFQKLHVTGLAPDTSKETQDHVNKFLTGSFAVRRELLKKLLEADDEHEGVVADFVRGVMVVLRKNPTKNWRTLKELLHRWQLMQQFNVNHRLQLEAWARTLEN